MTSLSAEQLAERQLLTVLTLRQEREYVSTLKPAGSAEVILGKPLRTVGREQPFDQVKLEIVAAARLLGNMGPRPIDWKQGPWTRAGTK